MIDRTLGPHLLRAARHSPVVAVTGPRQSGKTTLCRASFPHHDYVSLEPLDAREFAETDPRGFLAQHSGPVVFDEVQRVPGLFSYLQEEVDEDPTPGRFVLTGSQHFGLTEAISQSLAGRVALLQLLPLSLEEVRRFPEVPRLPEEPGRPEPSDLWTTVWSGGYPRILDRRLHAGAWLEDYAATYVQRDVRQVLQVTNLSAFSTLLRLAAGRTAQELNLSSLGADAGVAHPTVRAWLSVLEASFVVFTVPPWLRNFRKRLVKAPKLHFVDSGLACSLLGIRDPDQLRAHPLRGALFESWCASEALKARLHRGEVGGLFHLREARGLEVDLVVETARRTIGAEVKSGATVAPSFLRALEAFPDRAERANPHLMPEARLIYGGDGPIQRRSGAQVVPWGAIQDVEWT